jgi:hypothetical protein
MCGTIRASPLLSLRVNRKLPGSRPGQFWIASVVGDQGGGEKSSQPTIEIAQA